MTDEGRKEALIREMPEDLQILYKYAKEKKGVDLWDALDDPEVT